MKKLSILILYIIMITGCSFSKIDNDIINNNDDDSISIGEEYVSNRLIIKIAENAFKNNSDMDIGLKNLFLNKYNIKIISIRWYQVGGFYILETSDDCDIKALCEQLQDEILIKDSCPDYIAAPASIEVDDPYYHYQYMLNNTGQIYDPSDSAVGTSSCDISAPEGWEWTVGSENVVIAIIDSGVALDHEDLKDKIIQGIDIVDDDNDPYDDAGHGTFVASIASASTNNGLGIAGVSWNSKILPVKVTKDGIGTSINVSIGIYYAVANGARVLNVSLGFVSGNFVLEDACRFAFESNAVLVAATGNYGWEDGVLYPAAYSDYCFAVGATDANDERWDNSNYGNQIDVVAPGVNVVGAFFDPAEPDNLNSYDWGSGTSYATPCVSGTVALLIAYKPFLTNSQIMNLIKYTADDVNKATHPGVDDFIGYGRININRLLSPYISY